MAIRPNKTVTLAVTHSDGSVSLMEFVTFSRFLKGALGAVQVPMDPDYYQRDPTARNIQAEVDKTFSNEGRIGGQMVPPVSWRFVSREDITALDRTYRPAFTDTGKALTYDMPKAREHHRGILRHQRKAALADLDGQWMRAVGQKDKAGEARTEAERQKWRDAPADPRIEAAASVEELKQIKVG